MDKRIAVPAGLAIFVALAVVGMMTIFGSFATSTAEASISDISQDLQGKVDLAKLEQPFSSPLGVTAVVTGTAANATNFSGPAVQQTPEDPGAGARYTFKFKVATAMSAGVDDIILLFDSEFGVPMTIDRSHISISANTVGPVGTAASANESVTPLNVTVEMVGNEGDEPQITITIDDMDTSDGTGGNGIAATAEVTVVIRQSAGVTNPTEEGQDSIAISTSQETTEVGTTDEDLDMGLAHATLAKGMYTPAIIDFNSLGEGRGGEVTAVAKGFEGGTGVTFWLDIDADGVRDTAEIDLCTVQAASSDVATCSFDVNNPPFEPGTSIASTGDCTGTFVETVMTAGTIVGCNYINAIDGDVTPRSASIRNQADLDRQIMELKPSVTASPDEGNPGDTLTIQLKDYLAGALTAITIGGVNITTNADGDLITTETVPASGELSFTIKIPDGIPTGVLKMEIAAASTEDLKITVGSASLTPTPSIVVPNQRVSIIGSGFTDGGAATINSPGTATATDGSVVTIGGETIHFSKINDGALISIDDGGGFSASIDLPVTSSTTDGGIRELKIKDSAGRVGKINLTFQDPSITISPEEGQVSTNVTVSGTNFAAKNNDGNSISITVSYDAGTAGGTNTATATPNSSGSWSVTVQVPSDAPIPSTNTVKASYGTFDANTASTSSGSDAITTVTHKVPKASVSIDLLSGAPGTTITMTASGFKRFTPVTSLEVGTVDVTPSPKPASDVDGKLSFDFVIPGSDTGVQTVELNVGGTTASVGFTVTDDSGVTGVVTPIADALAPLFADDSLDRVFFFNNVTKEWSFYINDPAFSEANDLDELSAGQAYWIKVTMDKSVELNGKSVDLTCVNAGTPEEDCWNQIVY
jgi:hypothetical protein